VYGITKRYDQTSSEVLEFIINVFSSDWKLQFDQWSSHGSAYWVVDKLLSLSNNRCCQWLLTSCKIKQCVYVLQSKKCFGDGVSAHWIELAYGDGHYFESCINVVLVAGGKCWPMQPWNWTGLRVSVLWIRVRLPLNNWTILHWSCTISAKPDHNPQKTCSKTGQISWLHMYCIVFVLIHWSLACATVHKLSSWQVFVYYLVTCVSSLDYMLNAVADPGFAGGGGWNRICDYPQSSADRSGWLWTDGNCGQLSQGSAVSFFSRVWGTVTQPGICCGVITDRKVC
jgi:hypothetical protein